MVTVPNLWNVFVNLDMMDIFVLLLLVEMVAMQQQVGVQSQMNVGVKQDGQDLDAKHVYPIPDVKMDTVLNPGNVFVQENSKECFVILYYQIRIPPRNTVTSIIRSPTTTQSIGTISNPRTDLSNPMTDLSNPR